MTKQTVKQVLEQVLEQQLEQTPSSRLSKGYLPGFNPVPSRPVPTTIPPVPTRSTSADQDRFNTVDLIGSERASASNSAISAHLLEPAA